MIKTQFLVACVTQFALLLPVSSVWAAFQEPAAPSSDEVEQASASKFNDAMQPILDKIANPEPFQEISPEDVAAARSDLIDRIQSLDAQLARNGKSAESAWKQYLMWNTLEAELKTETPNRDRLMEVAAKFRQNHPGLEMRNFTALRSSLIRYANISFFAAEGQAKRIYDSRLKLIAAAIKQLREKVTDRTVALIGLAAKDLSNAQQTPELVALVRDVFSKPNLHFQVSEALVDRITGGQSTADVRPVNEVILGVNQRGTAHTTAQVGVDFVPSQNSAKFLVKIHGNTISDQVGVKDLGLLGSVQICSQGHTSLLACAMVDFDGHSISHSGINGDAKTRSYIKGVNTPPLLRGIVLGQIESQKSEGEKIAAGRARRKFINNVSDQVLTAIGKANGDLQSRLRTPAERLDFHPRRLQFSTTSDFLTALALVGNSEQLSGLKGPTAVEGNDLVFQIHESAINNVLQHMLGNRTITSKGLRQMMMSFGIDVPAPKPDDKPFSIEFARVRPVRVQFNADEVSVTIAVDSLKQGTAEAKRIEITASYNVKANVSRFEASRDGELEIKFLRGYDTAASILEANLRPKLEELFKAKVKDIDMKSLDLPNEVKALGDLQIAKFNLGEGWLSTAINIRKPGPAPATTTAVIRKLGSEQISVSSLPGSRSRQSAVRTASNSARFVSSSTR